MNDKIARRTLLPLSVALPKAWLVVAATFAALLAWFSAPTFRSVYASWAGYDYSHGPLVVGLTAWLIVLEVRRAPLQSFRPSWAGFACFLALAFLMTAALASTTLLGAHLAFPLLLIAAVWTLAGANTAYRFAVPLTYLFFAIPVWHIAIEPLQSLTVFVVSAWIRAAGIPAFIDGNFIHVPSGTFEVRGGCAGLRYALVAAALAAFRGLLHHRGWVPTLWLTVFALALAFVGNWVRIFILVVVGHLSEMQHSLITGDHSVLGWGLFVLFMTPLFYLDHRLLQRAPEPSVKVAAAVAAPSSRGRTVAYVVGVVLAVGIWLNHRIDQGSEPSPAAAATLESPQLPGWNRLADWQDARRPLFIGATADVASWYADDTARVGVFVAHYTAQGQEREIVFADNRPEGASGTVIARESITVVMASGASLPFQELEIADSAAEKRLVWLGLRVAGRPARSALAAKALQLAGVVSGRRDAQALVFTVTCGGDCEAARAVLSRSARVAAEPLYETAERYSPSQAKP